MISRIFKHHTWLIALHEEGYLKYGVNTHYSMLQHVMSSADVLQMHAGLKYLRDII